MRARLLIHSLARAQRDGTDETLSFVTGVNVIVGQQNSGKSTWLKMLDFLLFDTDSAKARFDSAIVSKYRSVSADMTVGDRRLLLTRQWDDEGGRSVHLIDGERVASPEAESLLLQLLQIPELRYPQGARTSERTWPSLGWRSIYRHMYRRQEFWNELVPRQPESEQHAVLLQFLGLAEALFSDELAQLVDKRREIVRAENRKDFFFQLVQQIAPGLFAEQELQVGLTEASIETAKQRLDVEIDALVAARSGELDRAREEGASFEAASDWLSEGFTTYLNRIQALDADTWTKAGAVTVRVSDRKTNFFIDGKPARTQLGGTLTIYFSFAYQYALLDLMRRPGTHFPGLAILDTFPDIAMGRGLRDPLGLVVRPYAELASQETIAPVQVILTARDFPATEKVHFIRLHDAWR
jgi:hypothetical protein